MRKIGLSSAASGSQMRKVFCGEKTLTVNSQRNREQEVKLENIDKNGSKILNYDSRNRKATNSATNDEIRCTSKGNRLRLVNKLENIVTAG